MSYGTRSRNIIKRAAFAALFVVTGIANFNRSVLQFLQKSYMIVEVIDISRESVKKEVF